VATLASALVALSVAVLPAQVAGAATLSVSNCNDSGPGSLRAAVGSAAPGDTITFSVSCPPASPIILTSGPIDITTNLTISGLGPNEEAVSGDGNSQVFDVASSVTATISGLTIEDGSANAYCTYFCGSSGGGIENSGTLTVYDDVVTNNAANLGCDGDCDSDGGGIENEIGAILTVTDSTLSDNDAGGNLEGCSAGCEASGGAIENFGTLTVTDSTVSDNLAAAGCGAACGSSGGGIDNTGGATIDASTISGNQANNSCTIACGPDGGGIENESGASLTLHNSTVADNSANTGCDFYCGASGGGIYNEGSVTFTNDTVSGNSVSGGCTDFCGNSGAAIYNGGSGSIGATIVANSSGASDCSLSPPLTDLGYNLDDDGSCGFSASAPYYDLPDTPAGLDPAGLADNGGPTQTIALEPGSPAIAYVADPALCPATDQRGYPRKVPCSIGAYEYGASLPSGSDVDAVIQVETSPSYAGDTVEISSSQLTASCQGTVSFETLQGGGVGNITTSPNSISVVLDDDGNATVVVEGSECAPGPDQVEADLTTAPYLTATTLLQVSPPAVTTAGVSGSPAAEVETGNSLTSGDSDVYAVFEVETDPVYAEQSVEISAPELESRCGLGWRWESVNEDTEIDGPSTTLASATTTLDDDGNATFVFEGASCAAGSSVVTADALAGTHPTYTTSFTVVAPEVTLAGTMRAATTKHHHHKGGSGSGGGSPTMTVTASPNPLVETGS
jgi:hypothetical protein